MKPSIYTSTVRFAFPVILTVVVYFHAISCQETRPFDVCGETVQCGDISLEYPFWGFDRPAYCGHPDFQLTCQSNVPLLSYESVNYRVLDMNTSTHTITIARNDLRANFCPQFLYNTSYNSTLFNGHIFGQRNVSLFYDCNTSMPQIPLGSTYQFTCDVNGSQTDGYFFRSDIITPGMANFFAHCKNHIDVLINQPWAARLGVKHATTDYLWSALWDGFQLQWTANKDECNQCIRSNGRCGSDLTSTHLFACYCANGNFRLNCNDSNGSRGKLFSNLVVGIFTFCSDKEPVRRLFETPVNGPKNHNSRILVT
ncbi:hypothetical protein L2E82_18539 [Cichorium intybus]|uniref:Uncharacterized protein n=1 Tax=Cichorium intybus TaxID=13427 RepID=A0ACB9FAE1_CICIN|nr:hypothetical protein L2E82_18539 [Cichorium intybus]